MELVDVRYHGPVIDDHQILDQLPHDYRGILEQINGFTQFGGGLHIRGACTAPAWHSLAVVWIGEYALSKLYPAINADDIPFGQDALGDQFILRAGSVHRLRSETGELDSLSCDFIAFLEAAQRDPISYLHLQPLVQFYQEEGQLQSGELISVYPPFCTKESASGISMRAISALERLAFLANFAKQIANVPNGSQIRITPGEKSIK
jgi:hypothetical protein